MKRKKAGGTLLVVSLVLGLGYWAGYQHGRNSASARLNQVSNLKQIGLAFRWGRNDVSRFAITGETAATKSTATPDQRRESRKE